MLKKGTKGDVDDLRNLASRTATAALTAAPHYQEIVLDAAEEINRAADNKARRERKYASEPAIKALPENATVAEVKAARQRQATRRGVEVYLPSWSAMARALPNAFLRTALFSTSKEVQADNDKILSGDQTLLVANKEIGSFENMTLHLSGYLLCQFDREVYANCLEYYRERPLAPIGGTQHIQTSFFEFASRMGISYGLRSHIAIRASLLRLSFAQMRLRYKRLNLEVPKLLSVSFEDGEAGGDYKGSDTLDLRVTTEIAELFGPGEWTSVELAAVGYGGLKGWLANFYAGHSYKKWLPIKTLYKLTGYESHMRNFKASLRTALDKLMSEETPECSRIEKYYFSEDETDLLVIRTAWGANTALSE